VVIIREISCTVVSPTADCVHQSGRVHCPDSRSEIGLGSRSELSPTFVVDDPGVDRGEREMLFDHESQLSFPFGLFWVSGRFGIKGQGYSRGGVGMTPLALKEGIS